MAYLTQEEKKELAPGIKKVLKRYGVKASIAINHHSTLVINIKEGALDLLGAAQRFNNQFAELHGRPPTQIGRYYQANPYRDPEDYRSIDSKVADFYSDLIRAMKGNRWLNKSDIMTDYHHVAYYLSINVGASQKPYTLTA